MTTTGSGANLISLAIALISLAGVIGGGILSIRAKRRTDKTEEGLAALKWAEAFEKRTERAETKAQAAEDKNAENERRQIQMERRLSRGEEAADALVEMIEWAGQVIDLAHDASDTDHVRLIRKINGGPPAYHRNR